MKYHKKKIPPGRKIRGPSGQQEENPNPDGFLENEEF